MEFDVFLSHNSKDKPAVRELKTLLHANNLKSWFDEDELQPGIPWQRLLEVGIRNSASVAVLVGKDGLGPWEDEEMQAALILAVKDKRPCIPVLLPGAPMQPELPMFLGNRTWVDLRSGFNDEGLGKLLWGITGKKPERIARESQSGKPAPQVLVAPTRLHHGADHLFGRDEELAALDKLASDPSKKILTIVAFGGVGKTSLVIEWMARQAAKNWEGWDRVFDWSFFSQGTREQGGASAEGFGAEALKFLGDEAMAGSAASAWDKGARLAHLVAQRRTLLVLDGVEPLQHPPGPLAGELKDPALATLLKGLARNNSGLCIVTTRERVADLASFHNTTAPEWQLHHLSIPAGMQLLKTLGVRGTAPEFKRLVEDVKGHALTLNLLGRYLAKAHGGDIRDRDQVKFEKADAATQGGYAFKTIGVYESWLNEGGEDSARQLAVLRLLGLFDRPADAGCMAALRSQPVIVGLTERLVDLADEDWNLAVSALEECGLVSRAEQPETPHSKRETALDAHPLIREYFAKELRDKKPKSWREGHRRLYEYLRDNTREGDEPTLEELQPLYQAVAHGCRAGLHRKACDEVYYDRIVRRDENYSAFRLGAVGSDMAAISSFFEQPWSRLSKSFSKTDQAWLMNEVGFRLGLLGRLTEAQVPLQSAVKAAVQMKDWANAATNSSNLCDVALSLGAIDEAIRYARNAMMYGDRSKYAFKRYYQRGMLAVALNMAGKESEASKHFERAEEIRTATVPGKPELYPPNIYCDLLLSIFDRAVWQQLISPKPNIRTVKSQQRLREISARAETTLKISVSHNWLLRNALGHLTLGCAQFYMAILNRDRRMERSKGDKPRIRIRVSADVRGEFDLAVHWLRRASVQNQLPQGLLRRSLVRFCSTDLIDSQVDLDEAWEIAERGPMRLFMADIHLYRARLFHAVKPYPWNKFPDSREGRGPKHDLADARKLIEKCGYWRRKEELEDAEEAAKSWD